MKPRPWGDLGLQKKGEISELGHRYLLEGMTRDIKDIFSVAPYLDKSLREVLKRS